MSEVRGFLAAQRADAFRSRIAAQLAAEPLGLGVDAHRRRVAYLIARLGDLDFFELLEVTPQAGPEDIHRAYVAVARIVHPRHADELALPGGAAILDLLFERVTEAYLTLSDPELARRYLAAGPERPAPAIGEQRQEEREREAAREFRVARSLAAEGRFHDAVQVLQQAVRLDRKAEHLALLARCLAENPNWLGRAVEACREAAEAEPQNVEHHLLLGRLQERRGDVGRAVAAYRRAVALDPGQQEARQALARLRPEAAAPERPGLLGRLLGRWQR